MTDATNAASPSTAPSFFWGRALTDRALQGGEVYDLLLISRLRALGADAELDPAQRAALDELGAKYSGGLAANLREAGLDLGILNYQGLPWFPAADKAEAVRDLLFNRGKLREEAVLLFRPDVDLATLRAEAPFHNGCGSAIWRGLAITVYGLPPKGYGAYGDIPRSTRRLEDLTPDPNYQPPAAEAKAPKAPKPPKEPKAPKAPKAPAEPKAPKAPASGGVAARDAEALAAGAASALAALAAEEGKGVPALAFRLAVKMSAAAVRSYKEMDEQERERRREATSLVALYQMRLRDKNQEPVPAEVAAAYPSEYLRRSISSADTGMDRFMLTMDEIAELPPLADLEADLERYYLHALPGAKLSSEEFSLGSRAFIRTYQWLKTKDPTLRFVDYEDLLNLALQAVRTRKADVLADADLMRDLVVLMQGASSFPARYAMENTLREEVYNLTQGL